nr:MAG TPA_asm: hypothetical protein [Caudoviricetes sp.]
MSVHFIIRIFPQVISSSCRRWPPAWHPHRHSDTLR